MSRQEASKRQIPSNDEAQSQHEEWQNATEIELPSSQSFNFIAVSYSKSYLSLRLSQKSTAAAHQQPA